MILRPHIRNYSRQLRKNQTDAEQRLWFLLRSGRFCCYKFRRQHPIGSFIVDFCCIDRRLIIELDGGQHVVQMKQDVKRTLYLSAEGYRVLRFWDNEVLKEIESVLKVILSALSNPHPTPLPPSGGRGS